VREDTGNSVNVQNYNHTGWTFNKKRPLRLSQTRKHKTPQNTAIKISTGICKNNIHYKQIHKKSLLALKTIVFTGFWWITNFHWIHPYLGINIGSSQEINSSVSQIKEIFWKIANFLYRLHSQNNSSPWFNNVQSCFLRSDSFVPVRPRTVESHVVRIVEFMETIDHTCVWE